MISDFFFGLIHALILSNLIASINKKLNNNNISIYFIFNISWVLLVSIYIMNFNDLPTISYFTKFYLLIYFSIFNIFYIFFRVTRISHISFYINISNRNNFKIINFFLSLWVVYFLYFIITIYINIGLKEYLYTNSARKTISLLGSSIDISYYIYGTLYLWGFTYFHIKHGYNKYYIYIIVSLSLLLTASKMNFVIAISGSLLIIFHYKNIKYTKLIIYTLPIIVGFFIFIVIFSIFTGKVIDNSIGSILSLSETSNITSKSLLYPYTYAAGTLAALDIYINEVVLKTGGVINNFYYTFIPIHKVLSKFGLVDIPPPSHILPFVHIKVTDTNVYSFFYELLHDFGLVGTIIFGIFKAYIFSITDYNIRDYNNNLLSYLLYSSLGTTGFLTVIAFKYNTTMFLIILIFILLFFIQRGKLFVKNNI